MGRVKQVVVTHTGRCDHFLAAGVAHYGRCDDFNVAFAIAIEYLDR